MPPEPSVTSACEGPRSCSLMYASALLPKSFERPGPKSVSPATYCSGVEVVVWWRWIVDMRAPYLGGVTPFTWKYRESMARERHGKIREGVLNGDRELGFMRFVLVGATGFIGSKILMEAV